jgi:hypothetical protein
MPSNEETLTLAPSSPVDTALNYADYARDGSTGGFPGLWESKYPKRSAGDAAIDKQETETRPHKCMQILAAEVRRLRAITPQAREEAAKNAK